MLPRTVQKPKLTEPEAPADAQDAVVAGDSSEKTDFCDVEDTGLAAPSGNPDEGSGATSSADPVIGSSEEAADDIEDTRGDVTFGGRRWYIMDEQEDKVLLWSVDIVDIRHYHDELTAVSWIESDLMGYLNTYFINRNFSSEERRHIERVNYLNGHFVSSPTRAFVPSIQEMQRLFEPGVFDERRIATCDGEPIVWWLRTMQGTFGKHAAVVDEEGCVLLEGRKWENGGTLEAAEVGLNRLYRLIDFCGVRACMWVNQAAFAPDPEDEADDTPDEVGESSEDGVRGADDNASAIPLCADNAPAAKAAASRS